MELGSFVAEVLKEISIGVEIAKRECSQIVIPQNLKASRTMGEGVVAGTFLEDSMFEHVEFVDFEVALSGQTQKNGGVKLGVLFSAIGANAEIGTKSTNDANTKVKFRIPIQWIEAK